MQWTAKDEAQATATLIAKYCDKEGVFIDFDTSYAGPEGIRFDCSGTSEDCVSTSAAIIAREKSPGVWRYDVGIVGYPCAPGVKDVLPIAVPEVLARLIDEDLQRWGGLRRELRGYARSSAVCDGN